MTSYVLVKLLAYFLLIKVQAVLRHIHTCHRIHHMKLLIFNVAWVCGMLPFAVLPAGEAAGESRTTLHLLQA